MSKFCLNENITQVYSIAKSKPFFVPIFLWIFFTPWSGWLDLKISQMFYHDSFISYPLCDWLYTYGIWPTWIIQILACIGLLSSLLRSTFRKWRNPCIFLLLTFAIGSGLIINACLKDHWGRPRPKQVTEFGGTQLFRSYYQPNFFKQTEPSKSFACGHASMGFYFFAFVILGSIYRSRSLYWLGWLLALGLGGMLSFARIIQGGHFLTDTLASALIMWLTSWTLGNFLLFRRERRNERTNTHTA